MSMFRRLGRRYDLPLDRDGAQRLLPWIVALMTYIAAMTLLAALVLGSLAWRWTDDVSGAVTVLLPPSTDQAVGSNEGRILGVRDVLATLPGVTAVEVLPAAEVARRLQPWLGAGASVEDLPLPRLVVLRVSPDRRPDVAQIRNRVEPIAPGAVVDDHGVWRAEIVRLATRMMTGAGLAVLLIAATAAVLVIFAVRSGLAIHRDTIEVLHLIGAHDDYIARQFQNHTTKLVFQGGLVALFVLGLSEVFLLQAVLGLDPSLMPRFQVGVLQWLAIALGPGVVVFVGMLAIANVTARLTVRRALARMV
jgi:cell division transport system permease protein